jgi:hypothetical protein
MNAMSSLPDSETNATTAQCHEKMTNVRPFEKTSYSHVEVAELLGISLETLHQLLRVNFFPEGTTDLRTIRFLPQDVLMFECWLSGGGGGSVPRRPH